MRLYCAFFVCSLQSFQKEQIFYGFSSCLVSSIIMARCTLLGTFLILVSIRDQMMLCLVNKNWLDFKVQWLLLL